jgi:hypothetical protein
MFNLANSQGLVWLSNDNTIQRIRNYSAFGISFHQRKLIQCFEKLFHESEKRQYRLHMNAVR